MPVLHPPAKLSCYEFGHQLLELNDLDPVYVLLHEAQLEREHLLRWLLSYWCFYHVGTASWCTDPWLYRSLPTESQETLKCFDTYWKRMLLAAGSKDYLRCHERRHFRGQFATDSVTKLYGMSIQDRFAPLLSKKLSLQKVFTVVTSWYGFGNWIAFKVADMLERLGLAEVEFSTGSIFMFDSPRKGAQLLCDIEVPLSERTTSHECELAIQEWAVNRILDTLGDYKAPPRYERNINVQEAETILCKWKSYMQGHYKLGEDVEGCYKALHHYKKSKTSELLLQAGKKGGLW